MAHALGVALSNLAAERLEEEVELAIQVVLRDSQVPFQEEEQLLLHEVHLGAAKSKAVSLGVDVGVSGPVLVLWRAVVEVLGGEDEGGEEDAVGGASKTTSHGLKLSLEASEVDKSRHESGNLDVGGNNKLSDEFLDSRQISLSYQDTGLASLTVLGRRGRRQVLLVLLRLNILGLGGHEFGIARDNVVSGVGEVCDHFAANGLVDELVESHLVELIHDEHPR